MHALPLGIAVELSVQYFGEYFCSLIQRANSDKSVPYLVKFTIDKYARNITQIYDIKLWPTTFGNTPLLPRSDRATLLGCTTWLSQSHIYQPICTNPICTDLICTKPHFYRPSKWLHAIRKARPHGWPGHRGAHSWFFPSAKIILLLFYYYQTSGVEQKRKIERKK